MSALHGTRDRPGSPARVDVVDGDIELALRRLKPALDEARRICRRNAAYRPPGETRRLKTLAARRRELKQRRRAA